MRVSNLCARLAAAAISIALIACTDDVAPQPDPEAAEQVGDAEPLPQTLPPPNESQPRYVGLWAASAEGCDEPAWRFEAERVTTRGEVSCTFDTVTPTENGYRLASTCYAEGPATPYTIELSFAESARAMMASGAPWAATALVYCRALPG